jgi:hypothetical protein
MSETIGKMKLKNETVGWYGPILDSLRENGGTGKPTEVCDLIAKSEKVPEDVLSVKDKKGGSRFYKQVNYARLTLVHEGLLDGSKRGTWILSKKGWETKLNYEDAHKIFLKWVEIERKARLAKALGQRTEEQKRPKPEVLDDVPDIPGGENQNKEHETIDDMSLPGRSYMIAGSEGGRRSVTVTRSERNPKNRQACLNHHGYKCLVCGFDFEWEFGDKAKKYIHVHHHNLLAETGEVVSDPINEMSPLCPNCHAVAHLKRPPYTIPELKEMRASSK